MDGVVRDRGSGLLRLRRRLRRHIVKRSRTVTTISSTMHHDHTNLRSPGQPVNSFVFLNAAKINGARLTGTLTRFLFSSRAVVAHVSVDRCRRGRDISHLIKTPPKCMKCSRNKRLARTVHHGPCSMMLFSRVRGTRPSMFGVLLRMLSSKQLASGGNHIMGFGGAVVVVASGVNDGCVRDRVRGLGNTGGRRMIRRAGGRMVGVLGGAVHPRFLGHVSRAVVFLPLARGSVGRVILLRVGDMRGVLTNGKMRLRLASTTLSFLSRINCSPRFNTHPMGETVRECLLGSLSGGLLTRRMSHDGTVVMSTRKSKLIFHGWGVGEWWAATVYQCTL